MWLLRHHYFFVLLEKPRSFSFYLLNAVFKHWKFSLLTEDHEKWLVLQPYTVGPLSP